MDKLKLNCYKKNEDNFFYIFWKVMDFEDGIILYGR